MSKEDIKKLAGIVTFNSDISRLRENVDAIYPQVDKVLIVDNGSKNIEEIKRSLGYFECVEYLCFDKNLGIAQALSSLMDYAIENNYDWVLSLDDDSVAMPGLVSEYKKYINIPKVATMTCFMEDRNYPRNEKKFNDEFIYVDRCITSGCFMNVSAYKKTEGYSVDFFIDRVDDDICYNFTKYGFKHIKVNFTGLLHEMGKGQIKKFLWHNARADNYSPFRRYYIYRNETIVRKKYPDLIKKEWLESGRPMIVNFGLHSMKILFYEKDKIDKISAM